MVIEPREPPRIGAYGPTPRAGETFARPAAAPAVRRLAVPRVAALSAMILLAVGGSWAIRAMVAWLHDQEEYRVDFNAIKLDPPPPRWIKTGGAGLLAQARAGMKLGAEISLLDQDLDEIRKAFWLSPWVREVGQVVRSDPRSGRPPLRVPLRYHEPVATVPRVGEPPRPLLPPIYLDERGNILPGEDLDVAEAGSLLVVEYLNPPLATRPGPYATDGEGPDARAEAAARLAEFLKRAMAEAPRGSAPTVVRIDVLHGPDSLMIRTEDQVWVHWGEAPGREAPGHLPASKKWEVLRAWSTRGGPRPEAGKLDTQYLEIGPSGVSLREGTRTTPEAVKAALEPASGRGRRQSSRSFSASRRRM